MIGVGFAENIVETVTPLKPDIIIHTGDFYDHSLLDPEGTFATMRKLEAPLGKYAIIGNHEYINKIEASKKHIEHSGFHLIENNNIEIGENLVIVSVADASGKRFGYEIPDDEEILQNTDRSKYIIFLKHRPKLKKGTEKKFDLMLSDILMPVKYFLSEYL